MAFGVTFFIIATLVIVIWLLVEFKRMKHKLFAIAIIGLLIFGYVTINLAIKGKDLDFKTFDGWKNAGKLYFSWFSGAVSNMKSITNYAIHKDWKSTDEKT